MNTFAHHHKNNLNLVDFKIALPKIELFDALNELLTQYPIPSDLRDSLIRHLDTVLKATLPNDPRAVKILCTRCLRPDMRGEELVDGIKQANETLMASADSKNEPVFAAYAEFVKEWSRALIDEDLVSPGFTCSTTRGNGSCFFTENLSNHVPGAINPTGEDVSIAAVCAHHSLGRSSRWKHGADQGSEVHVAGVRSFGAMARASGRRRQIWK